jgi:hypothetical protein
MMMRKIFKEVKGQNEVESFTSKKFSQEECS